MAGRVTRCQCRKCEDGMCGVETTNLNEFTSAAICDACQRGDHRVRELGFDLALPGPASTRDMDAFGPFEDYEGREASA